MPRCDGCGNQRCRCVLVDGDNTEVLGTGSTTDPYRVNAVGEAGGSRLSGEIIAYGGGVAPTGWLLCDGAAISRTTYSDLFTILGETYGEGDGSTTFNLPDLAGRLPFGADGGHPRGTIGGLEQITITPANLPAHSHTIAHTHDIAHTHGMAHVHDMTHGHGNTAGMSANANHHHEVKATAATNTATSGGGNRIVSIGGGPGGGNSENTNTDHVHAVAAFGGTTGGDTTFGNTGGDSRGGSSGGASPGTSGNTGGGTAHTNMPPYTAVSFIIKT